LKIIFYSRNIEEITFSLLNKRLFSERSHFNSSEIFSNDFSLNLCSRKSSEEARTISKRCFLEGGGEDCKSILNLPICKMTEPNFFDSFFIILCLGIIIFTSIPIFANVSIGKLINNSTTLYLGTQKQCNVKNQCKNYCSEQMHESICFLHQKFRILSFISFGTSILIFFLIFKNYDIPWKKKIKCSFFCGALLLYVFLFVELIEFKNKFYSDTTFIYLFGFYSILNNILLQLIVTGIVFLETFTKIDFYS